MIETDNISFVYTVARIIHHFSIYVSKPTFNRKTSSAHTWSRVEKK
jgi:hypothetical protein